MITGCCTNTRCSLINSFEWLLFSIHSFKKSLQQYSIFEYNCQLITWLVVVDAHVCLYVCIYSWCVCSFCIIFIVQSMLKLRKFTPDSHFVSIIYLFFYRARHVAQNCAILSILVLCTVATIDNHNKKSNLPTEKYRQVKSIQQSLERNNSVTKLFSKYHCALRCNIHLIFFHFIFQWKEKI